MPQDVNPLLDRLCAAFPACFDRKAPKPLRIGLGEERVLPASLLDYKKFTVEPNPFQPVA